MKYLCREGDPPHPCATSYCHEHDCPTVVDKRAPTTAPPRSTPAGSGSRGGADDTTDPIEDLLHEGGPSGSSSSSGSSRSSRSSRASREAPAASASGQDDVQIPPGVLRRYRILRMLPAESAVGGRLWLAAPVDSPQGMVLLKVHAPGFRPGAVKDRLRDAGFVTRVGEGVETLPNGGPTVTWEALLPPSGGTLRKVLDDALGTGRPSGRLGGLPEHTVLALLTKLADLLETWERDFGAVPVNLSPDTLHLRDLGGFEPVIPDLDGVAVLDEECARGPHPPLTRYLAPAHLTTRGRWGARGAWVSVAAVMHELLTGRPQITAGPDPDELADAVFHRPSADTGDPLWDELLNRMAGGRTGAEEVRAWCADRDSAAAPVESFRLGDRIYDDPADLVSALVDSGTNGRLWLGDPDNAERLAGWLECRAPHADRGVLDRFLRSPSGPYANDRVLAALAAEFLPFARPRFRGDIVDEDGLVALAEREDIAVLHAVVLDSGILRDASRQTCARHGGEAGCPVLRGLPEKVTRALETARQETERTAEALEHERGRESDELRADVALGLVPNGAAWYDAEAALATVVRLLVGDDDFLRHCRERLAKTRRAGVTPGWWGRLYDLTVQSLGREPSGPLGTTTAGLVAAALAFDVQVVAFQRALWRARRNHVGRRAGAIGSASAQRVRSWFTRSAESRDEARTRRRQNQGLLHRRLLRLRWLWVTAFTVGLLDMVGYTAYGWVPYTPPVSEASTPAPQLTFTAGRAVEAGGVGRASFASAVSGHHKKAHRPAETPGTEPLWRSRSQLWQEARTDAAPRANDMVTSLHDLSDQVGEDRPDWAEDGAFFAYGTRLPEHLPWLMPALVMLGTAAGLRWAVRGRTLALRLVCALVATLCTTGLLWHLYADGLTHALLAAAYALDFWHGTAWVAGVLVVALWACGSRGTTPVETRRNGPYGSRYGG